MREWPSYNNPQFPFGQMDNYFPVQQPTYPYNNPYQFQSPFEQYAKPKQPLDWYNTIPNQQPFLNFQQQAPFSNPNPNSFLNQFQNEKGQFDLDKMLNTAGKMANTFQQITPVVKQFSSFMNNFK